MNKELLDYIKLLSLEDPKNLQGKALKTTSEAGDLAEKTLAYTMAAGSMHNFAIKQDVLHEAVDTILCAFSVAYDLGFSNEEIESMMVTQCAKWRKKQFHEQKLKDPKNIPYEIHITIDNVMSSNSILNDGGYGYHPDFINIEHFSDICKVIGVKPIILDLQNIDGGTILHDYQTSSVFFGTNAAALEEVNRISNELKKHCFKVLREKIETVFWHPCAPSKNSIVKVMPLNSYFESHLGVIVNDDSLPNLRSIATCYDAHLSKNIFKKLINNEYILMLTLRKYDGIAEDFEELLTKLENNLKDSYFQVEKRIIEFAIYDSNVKHDAVWI